MPNTHTHTHTQIHAHTHTKENQENIHVFRYIQPNIKNLTKTFETNYIKCKQLITFQRFEVQNMLCNFELESGKHVKH